MVFYTVKSAHLVSWQWHPGAYIAGIAAVVQGQRNTAASCWESSAVRKYAVFAIFPLPYKLSREMSTCCSSPGTSHLLGWVLLCHCKWTEVSYWNHQLHKYVSGAPSHGVWVFLQHISWQLWDPEVFSESCKCTTVTVIVPLKDADHLLVL